MSLLLKAGANPNARSMSGGTPLHAAAGRPESFAQIRLLVEAGAEADPVRVPSTPFEPRDTPLSLAAYMGDERTVKFLLDHGLLLATPEEQTARSRQWWVPPSRSDWFSK